MLGEWRDLATLVDVAAFDTILLFGGITGRGTTTLSAVPDCLSLFTNLVEMLQPRQKLIYMGSAGVYVNTKVAELNTLNTLSTLTNYILK
jgi:hypothetical protein